MLKRHESSGKSEKECNRKIGIKENCVPISTANTVAQSSTHKPANSDTFYNGQFRFKCNVCL